MATAPRVAGTIRSKNPLKGAVEILPVRFCPRLKYREGVLAHAPLVLRDRIDPSRVALGPFTILTHLVSLTYLSFLPSFGYHFFTFYFPTGAFVLCCLENSTALS